jgi:hypothetical protein
MKKAESRDWLQSYLVKQNQEDRRRNDSKSKIEQTERGLDRIRRRNKSVTTTMAYTAQEFPVIQRNFLPLLNLKQFAQINKDNLANNHSELAKTQALSEKAPKLKARHFKLSNEALSSAYETMLASPKEQIEAREILQGKNLMPYLNKSDRRAVYQQFRKLGRMRHANGKRFSPSKNSRVIQEMTRKHSKEYRLDIESKNMAIEAAGQTQRLLRHPVELNYRLELMKEARKNDANEMLRQMLQKDTSVMALDPNLKGPGIERNQESPLLQRKDAKSKRKSKSKGRTLNDLENSNEKGSRSAIDTSDK